MKKWNISLRLSDLAITDKIDKAREYVAAMTENKDPYFPDPSPPLAEVSATTDELEVLFLNSREGSRADTQEMYDKEFELDIKLIELAAYVQTQANKNTDIGSTIIKSAAMEVRNPGGKAGTRLFTVANTSLSGVVFARTGSAGSSSAYIWEYSANQQDWTVAKTTTIAEAEIPGLEPGVEYAFRMSVVKRSLQGPYQGPVFLIVT